MDDESVDAESFEAAIEELQIERDVKLANIGLLVKEINADIETRKRTIDELKKMNTASSNRIASLKKLAMTGLDQIKESRIKTPLIHVSKQRGRLSLVVDDDAQLPDQFYKRTLNKTALSEALKEGEEYHGVRYERGDDFVVVR